VVGAVRDRAAAAGNYFLKINKIFNRNADINRIASALSGIDMSGLGGRTNRIRYPGRSILCEDSGNTTLEFALVAPILFLFVFAVLVFGTMVFARSVLDNATIDAARTFRTGNASAFASTLCADAIIFTCTNLQYNIQAGSRFAALTTAIKTTATGNLANSAGGSAQQYPAAPNPAGTSAAALGATPFMIVQVGYQWSFGPNLVANAFGLPNGVLLVSTAAFENEAY
jgi:Flp pilus assembly protein TadG